MWQNIGIAITGWGMEDDLFNYNVNATSVNTAMQSTAEINKTPQVIDELIQRFLSGSNDIFEK